MSCCLAIREQLVFGSLVEDVVDDLHAVDKAASQCPQNVRRLAPVHADAERAHELLPLEIVHRPLPAVIVRPCVAPDVKLLEVDRGDAKVREALLGVLANVIGRICVGGAILGFRRPLPVLWRDLGRNDGRMFGGSLARRTTAERFAEQLLAAAFAVHPRRVEEVAPESHRLIDRLQRFLSSDPVQPPMPHMP